LTWLSAGQAEIADISALAGLTNLTFLALSENQIVDVSALASLTNLTWLSLWDNQVVDVSPLAGLTRLAELSVTHNPLSKATYCFDMCTTIMENNPGIDFPRPETSFSVNWVAVGQPDCWCNLRQCHGDADDAFQGKSKYYVCTRDLDILLAAWNKPFADIESETLDGAPLVCADFDHIPQGTNKYRVSTNDIDILVAHWMIKEPPDGPGVDPNCLDWP